MSESSRVWIVGAEPSSDIVVKQPTVPRRHCKLEIANGVFSIEDLGSTNGTFVNGQKVSDKRQIKQGDKITLGKGVVLTLPRPVGAETETTADTKESSRNWNQLALPLVGLILAGALVYVGWNLSRSGSDVGKRESVTSDKPGPVDSKTIDSNSKSPGERKPASKNSVNEMDGVYAFIVISADEKEVYAIGTAVAIGEHTLATSASVLAAAEKFKERFPTRRIFDPKTRQSYGVRGMNLHPQYARSSKKLASLRERHANLSDLVDQSPKGEKADKELQALEQEAWELDDEKTSSDVATIEVEISLSGVRQLSYDGAPDESTLTMIGMPRPLNDYAFTALASEKPPRVSKCKATKREGFLTSEAPNDALGLEWVGSPLVNSEGEIVAIYSHSAGEEGDGSRTFQAAYSKALKELVGTP